MISITQAYDYLEERGRKYGITLEDMLSKTPDAIQDNPHELLEFWQNKDISHIYPIETHPELQGDPSNWFPEDASDNRSKNSPGYIRTGEEVLAAINDNNDDVIDSDYDDDGIPDALL